MSDSSAIESLYYSWQIDWLGTRVRRAVRAREKQRRRGSRSDVRYELPSEPRIPLWYVSRMRVLFVLILT